MKRFLYSRANLAVAKIAATDQKARALAGVHFESDGSTVAGNGRAFLAVEPAEDDRAVFPEHAAIPLSPGSGVLLDVAYVKKVASAMSKGIHQLEYAQMSKLPDPGRVGFTCVDKQGDPSTIGTLPKPFRYPDWRKGMAEIHKASGGTFRICLDKKDLAQLLDAFQTACPNRGSINPIYLEFDPEGGGVIVRCENPLTKQHVIGVIMPYDTKGRWLMYSVWEKMVLQIKRAMPKRKRKRQIAKQK